MKIAAGIVEYADPDGLDRCLSSLGLDKETGGFDGAIVIHRKFDHFEIENKGQIDYLKETLAVAKKYPNVYVDHSEERITQIEARNLYMQKAGELGYDWLMVIDSDEYVLPNAGWKKFRTQLEYVQSLNLDDQIFEIQFAGSLGETGPRPRLFLRPAGVFYWIKHYWFVISKKQMLCKGVSDSYRVIEGIYVRHGKIIRTPEHIKASLSYYEWQDLIEQPRDEHYANENQIWPQRVKHPQQQQQ